MSSVHFSSKLKPLWQHAASLAECEKLPSCSMTSGLFVQGHTSFLLAIDCDSGAENLARITLKLMV